ncbi:AMP-binding protein [Bacillus sp. RG28]|uniref:AMP-binding protein n=1 Tax=Gottfriedia endophytica TaxID=2820819 RepID=A0A940NKX6_9BACI|nr:AMP-binding protein [Gottfriedia endophytica]MBP0726355.1 AMP-binding protein [Gottfriedia endophytica]
MQYNVLEYLENTVKGVPNKLAYANEQFGFSFKEVYNQGRAIGTFLYQQGVYKQPVVVFMNRNPKTIVAFYGVIYGGNFYVPIDEEMPSSRIELILNKINPRAIICDEDSENSIKSLGYSGAIYLYDDIIKTNIEEKSLFNIRQSSIDTDPVYIVYTSGSTGIPKGVIACHRSIIDYIESLSEALDFNQDTIFGNQTPLYLDACFKELFPTLKFGATTFIIPKSLFMFPIKLVEFLNEYKVNTVCWVVSALTMISSFKVFDKLVPEYLHTIAFGSEVFPIKQFHLWKKACPNAKFINLYGPTEATGMSCYFIVDRELEENEVIPIGRPFRNTEILLLDTNNKPVTDGDVGEICIKGTCLTLGYYQDFERTYEVFVQNPLNKAYRELIYKTGDLGKYNKRKELVFVSRKDYQIKHMGYRIELGEIEMNVNSIEPIKSACCIYDKKKQKIVLYYVGDIDSKDIVVILKQHLPKYMIPNRIVKLDLMPLTTNGKIDRLFLSEYEFNTKKETKI